MTDKLTDFDRIMIDKDKQYFLLDFNHVSDFIITHETRRVKRDGWMNECYRFYYPSGQRSSRLYETYDEAVLDALAVKYLGLNTQAGELMVSMLQIHNGNNTWE